MPDIFGNNEPDYSYIQQLRAVNEWDGYQARNAEMRPTSNPTHDFNALRVRQEQDRATDDAAAAGYITNNLLAIQSYVDEILFTTYRLPMYLALNTSIPEGARSTGVRVRTRYGKAQKISGPGFEAPSATVGETLVTSPIDWYGLDAEWSIDELRGAMFAGTPLDTDSVNAAVTGTLETMEEVGLLGEGDEPGLLTLPITGSNSVVHITADQKFEDMNAVEIRTLINTNLTRVINDTKETIGRNLTTGMTVYLPNTQYGILTDRYIGDDAEKTVMRAILEDNTWTHFSGQPLRIESVLELEGRGQGGTDRMVIGLRNSRIIEMPVSINPRVLTTMNKGRVVCALVEAKFGTCFVKRPNTITYVDGV